VSTQYDGFYLDRGQVLTFHGVACYSLRGVRRRGEKLDMARRRRVDVSDIQEFILPDKLPEGVLQSGDRLLIPVDVLEDQGPELVPWLDLPDRGTVARGTRGSGISRTVTTKTHAGPRRTGATKEPAGQRRWEAVAEWPGFWVSLAPTEAPEPPTEDKRGVILRRALDLAKSAKDGQSALNTIAERAMDAGQDEMAVEAINALKPSGEWSWACFANVAKYLSDRGRSIFLAQPVAASWERRALAATDDDGWAAGALALLGLRRLMRGEGPRALELWNAASAPSEIDDLLAKVAREVAEWGWTDWAMNVVETIDDVAARAEALAVISEHF
jgi:hypothetical protein